MPDQAKIINGLEWCIRTTKAGECKFALVDCPYIEECKTAGSTSLLEDCLEYMKLLKEQNAVKPKQLTTDNGFIFALCGACDRLLPVAQDFELATYCPSCGKKVKWNA